MIGQVAYIYEPYRLDWGQVMAFACDYMGSRKEWEHHRSKNLYADARSRQYRHLVEAEMALYGISCAIGIPMYVLVSAARCERKYYKKHGLGRVDYERLIVALECNKEEYPDE